MKKLTFVLVLLALPAMAFAQSATMSLKMADGTSAVTLPETGGSIQIKIFLDSATGVPEGIASIDGTIVASQSGIFTGTARTFGAPFINGNFPTATNMNGAWNPNSPNFGAVATAGSSNEGNYLVDGTDGALPWTIETVTVTVAPTPGVYTLALSSLSFAATTDGAGTGIQLPTSLGSPITVTVTPEPATMLLLTLALPFLRRRSA